MRPMWLSRPEQRADVVIGNPPWIAYRYLSAEIRPRFQAACRAMNLWVGGRLATNQDVSALFWARAGERYLRQGGGIAFVLPYAALNRPAFGGLRSGNFVSVQVRILEVWDLARVRPMFGEAGTTSSCVVFGRREAAGPLPREVERFAGTLTRRDATETEADADLHRARQPWPAVTTLEGQSIYRARFKQGATIVPRRFFIVEREPASRFGENPEAPRVRGRTSAIDKAPWKNVDAPRGPMEAGFLHPLLLGESIAPFRLRSPALAVVPVDNGRLLDAAAAADAGHRHLAAWLRDIEGKWTTHSRKDEDGVPRMTLQERIDFASGLSEQLSRSWMRVVYVASGTIMSASTVEDTRLFIEHGAYWATARDVEEARYLTLS